MWEKVKKALEFSSKNGIYLPMAYDNDRKKPSVTLLAFYLAMVVSVCSVIALHFSDGLWVATSASLLLFSMTFMFYRLRKLTSAKIDLDDKSIEFSSESNKKSESNNKKDPEPND
jgi:hypothetical protein